MKNKKPQNKNSFNQYWIYGGIILLFLLINLFTGANGIDSTATTPSKFLEFVKNGDVEKIEIINKREVRVFLTRDAELKDIHRNTVNKSFITGTSLSPNYKFEFGDLQNFENSLAIISRENNINVETNYVTEQNYWGDFLISLLPFILIIAIWIFIMRRMSSSAGGGGGQIFNIGKSKAKLFDANSDMKITFKDVAGLEGAKEEVQEIVDFLKNPKKYTALGGKIPKGALLIGAPWYWKNSACKSCCR